MRTMTLRGVLTLTLLALSATTSYAQSLLTGNVVDEQNKPVVGAVIKFELKESKIKRETTSDKKGAYLIVGLPTGNYTITASKGDMVDTATASLKQAKASINFTLRSGAAATASGKKGGPAGLEGAAAGSIPDAEKDKNKQQILAIQATATAAIQAVRDQRHEEAIPKLNEVIAFMPNCSDCYMYLGMSLFGVNKFDEAEAALKKSVELQPTVEGYTTLVRFYTAQNKHDLAGEYSKKASDLSAKLGGTYDPATGRNTPSASSSSETLYNEGVVLWNAKKYAEAKPQFEAAVKVNADNADAHYMLGMANLNLGQVPAARAAFEAYLKAAPNGPKAAEVKGFLSQLPK